VDRERRSAAEQLAAERGNGSMPANVVADLGSRPASRPRGNGARAPKLIPQAATMSAQDLAYYSTLATVIPILLLASIAS
jgi:hypothetical protein